MSVAPVIRRVGFEDLPQVMRIEYASYTTPWTEATFRELLRRSDAVILGAEAEGRLVGYAVFWVVADQGELGNIAVAPDWRGRGVGKKLLEAVIEQARGRAVRELFLEVRVSNEPARRLYETHGFREVGRRKNYYSVPTEDALVMCKLLDI
ncbi:MAG TPA: ribosomal protein S18-alanine N-acetyltransferase [Longimicrobiales bacterium]|nr:ribosomal protein S18-alanine N-acetyltransferase [Longimicrobiales bacterium]